MAIWSDTIKDIVDCINTGSKYNVNRSTTVSNFGLSVYNQAQDWLCQYKDWRDLRVRTQLTVGTDKKITLPSDCGKVIIVFTDPSNMGKPMYCYYLNHPDVAMRYTEEVTQDGTTGTFTRKLCFPNNTFLPQNPYVDYIKVLSNATQAEYTEGTKKSFFPKNVMLLVAKMILQDYYGVAANNDPNWITKRVKEELERFEQYAYGNNYPLDKVIHDRFGNPIFIQGMQLDGSKPRINRPTPYLPSTLFTGGSG